jgi:cytochrome c
VDAPRVGPALRAVDGRRAASDPKFPYSDALKRAHLTWDEDTLNRWLADPDALVPDTDMAFRLTQAEERAAIIAYLQELAGKR